LFSFSIFLRLEKIFGFTLWFHFLVRLTTPPPFHRSPPRPVSFPTSRRHRVPDGGKMTWHQLDFSHEFMATLMVSVSYQSL